MNDADGDMIPMCRPCFADANMSYDPEGDFKGPGACKVASLVWELMVQTHMAKLSPFIFFLCRSSLSEFTELMHRSRKLSQRESSSDEDRVQSLLERCLCLKRHLIHLELAIISPSAKRHFSRWSNIKC